jgi:hypothetical protein
VWLLLLIFIAFISEICASADRPAAPRNIQKTMSTWSLHEDYAEAMFGVGMNNSL